MASNISQKRSNRLLNETISKLLKPPSTLSMVDWIEENRVLTAEDSAITGSFSFERTPYARGVFEALQDPHVHTVVLQWGSQVGKTTQLLSFLAWLISEDPGPVLFVLPSLSLVAGFSRDRLDPMLRSTKALQGLVSEVRSNDSDNSLYRKRIVNGSITLASSSAHGALQSRPIKYLIGDEIDAWETAVGLSDSIDRATQRTRSFPDRKIILTSTPTIKGESRIEALYDASDRRSYYIRCPECNHQHTIKWENIKWDNHDPDTARVECPKCDHKYSKHERHWAINNGTWVAQEPTEGVAGFFLPSMYSCMDVRSDSDIIVELVKSWRAVHKIPERRHAFVNEQLAEAYEVDTEEIAPDDLRMNIDTFENPPAEIEYLLIGSDLQGDRLESSIMGYNSENGIIYVVDHVVTLGDPNGLTFWEEVDKVRELTYTMADGRILKPAAQAIDCGYLTERVHHYVGQRRGEIIIPVKGFSRGNGAPLIKNYYLKRGKSGRHLDVNPDEGKLRLTERLRSSESLVLFADHLDQEYYDQLTSEVLRTKYVRGARKRAWTRIQGREAEALDCFVYALALNDMLMQQSPNAPARLAARSKVKFTVPKHKISTTDEPAKKTRFQPRIRTSSSFNSKLL